MFVFCFLNFMLQPWLQHNDVYFNVRYERAIAAAYLGTMCGAYHSPTPTPGTAPCISGKSVQCRVLV